MQAAAATAAPQLLLAAAAPAAPQYVLLGGGAAQVVQAAAGAQVATAPGSAAVLAAPQVLGVQQAAPAVPEGVPADWAAGRQHYGAEQGQLGVRVAEFHDLSPFAQYVHPSPALKLQSLWDGGNELVRRQGVGLGWGLAAHVGSSCSTLGVWYMQCRQDR